MGRSGGETLLLLPLLLLQVEAAIAVYASLMRPESFPLLLETCFDEGERENVLHRLGLRVTEDGAVEVRERGVAATPCTRTSTRVPCCFAGRRCAPDSLAAACPHPQGTPQLPRAGAAWITRWGSAASPLWTAKCQ